MKVEVGGQDSGIKGQNRKREVPFFGRGEETLSKIGEDLKERQS